MLNIYSLGVARVPFSLLYSSRHCLQIYDVNGKYEWQPEKLLTLNCVDIVEVVIMSEPWPE